MTFEELPKAIELLIQKVSHLEEILVANENHATRTEQSVDVNQAAEFLNIAVQTLYGKVSRREVPVNKRGKHLHFYISELEEWLRKGRKRTVDEVKEAVGSTVLKRIG